MSKTDDPQPITRHLEPGRMTPLIADVSGKATVLADGKIRLELIFNGELGRSLRSKTMAANRSKLRGRQRPRPG